jgi:acetyl esterase/lipase
MRININHRHCGAELCRRFISRFISPLCCRVWFLPACLLLAAPLCAQPEGAASTPRSITALTSADWADLKRQSEQSPPLPGQALASYFATGHFFPALPVQPLLSADGRWVYYWRRQGLQYWLCRSQGDGEEQVLHKQREVPPSQLVLSRDQQQLWLAATDLLQLLDIRRKTLRTVWQPGFALPGQKQIPSRHSMQVIQLSAEGAVLQWQQAATSYWFLTSSRAARQIWPTPQRSAWQDISGKVLVLQPVPEQKPDHAATETTAGLLPDISQLLRSANGELLATARLYQRLDWQSEDPAWQTLLNQLQARRPQCSMQLQSAASKLLVSYSCSDQTDAQHLLLTLDGKLQIRQRQLLQLSTTASLPAGVSPQQVAWQAQDGQTIPGYLYLPPGLPLAHRPLVTLIHGGPFSRSDPAYDVLVQWLVNRGAIVLQPDYRSSAGFGQAFMQAAQGDFGPDSPLLGDIFSGLDLLLQSGIGDPAQQAVIGHSFGGYLAIQALQAQPQRFRFGLALAAPVDLAATLQTYLPVASTPFGQPSLSELFQAAGVPWQDRDWQQQLSAESPLTRTTFLQRPLYLWAGGQDDRISAAALQQFQQQAIMQGKTVRLWLDPDSGHQAGTLQSRRLQFYLAASLVISHLPAGPEAGLAPAVSDASQHQPLDTFDSLLQTLEVRPATTGN